MSKTQSLMKPSDVAQRLCINVQTLKKYADAENWDMIPKPKDGKVIGQYRWDRAVVLAFENGEPFDHKTADPKKLPDDWSKYID